MICHLRRKLRGIVRSQEINRIPEKMAKPLGTTGEFFRRRDEWRKHPMLSNQMRHALPGLGIGVAAFCVYLVGEQIYNKALAPSKSSHHHQEQTAPSH
ncbi:unnamed protein product [Arabidopsis thaliana]|uniref:NADH dehydrogenase [ubiquinone] 1 beta subcomplex subunit 3-B n=3 Tax=Arabidopsis TaxID=3701 RepID=A0A654EAJ7_ARATH|nr:NADH dehydrogenase (ubiquinone)s [Arabidopsis thaliana]ANM59968.1 NADH dehydrogenase (ubiquinone)s [Arabidopsis thaliana]KAG7646296.1 NADH dehydrogenase [ubiquinone] 1 beta subcomplex subunit 3 [Arabidopsis thaliana x Arabidopsis arenosa]CAA0203520.1 unnamed protein product [Arabidopsis thaliana]VYS46064.1 unnamed protein product [Arabidopsis thaliana]|eukprot:NP_001322284.1 NADH dehydrogenase (ubiquinone)s [Arabidopsis thaliana]